MAKLTVPKIVLPPARQWLPAVVLILCLSMFGIIGITLFTAGADPESGPAALPTSTAAQGYQGLRRLLVQRGHYVASNRFEDGAGEVARGDIEIITLNNDGGVYEPTSQFDWDRPEEASSSASASDSSSASPSNQAAPRIQPIRQFAGVPDKRRSDHVLYKPLGRVVIVVAPKWVSGLAMGKPRWGADPQAFSEQTVRSQLAFLSPMTERPSPYADEEEETYDEDGEVVSASAEPRQQPQAPPGKEAFDNGEMVYTWDKVGYDVRRTRTQGAVTLRGASGTTTFAAPLEVGAMTDLQSITGPNLTPVLVGPNGEALISRVHVTEGRVQPKVPVYLVSDPDLLNNQILSDPRKVVAALTLLDSLAPADKKRPSVVFNLTFNNLAFDHDLFHALSRPPYLGVSLSLILLGLGLVWAAFSRFGPPQLAQAGPALGRGVRVLADNAARLMAIAVKEAKLGPAYAQMVRDEVLKDRGHRLMDPNQSPDELADRIGQIYGASETYTALKAKGANILTVHQLIDYARSLHTWKTEIERANQ